jgi:hypothetical protein
MDQVTVDRVLPTARDSWSPVRIGSMGCEVSPPFGGSHRLVVISGHHCALDQSLVRVDRDVLYNDLLLSATSVVIKSPTKLELAINLKTAKASVDVPLRPWCGPTS